MTKIQTYVICPPYTEDVIAARFIFEYRVNQTERLTDQ